MLSKNQIINKVECIDNTIEGHGIVKFNGQVIFVSKMIKGEKAKIKIIKASKKIAWAIIINLIKESPDRVSGICESYPMCGGCSLLHIKYGKQFELKKQTVINNFKKYANVDIEISSSLKSPNINYRNKASYPISFLNGNYITGFYRVKTNVIIEHKTCINQCEQINEAIKLVIKKLNINGIDFKLRHIVIRKVDQGLAILFVTKKITKKLIDFIKTYLGEFSTISVNENISSGNKIIDGPIKCVIKNVDPTISISDFKFVVSDKSFFQVNDFNTKKLYDLALLEIKTNSNILELYSGTGTISCLAAKSAKFVTAIEINDDAVSDANKNKILNNIKNINFINNDATNFAIKNKSKFDCVIIDPPRKGLSSKSYEHLIKIDAKQIIYISCSSNTLARDYDALSNKYDIGKIMVVDMFPNTKHIETILVMNKKIV